MNRFLIRLIYRALLFYLGFALSLRLMLATADDTAGISVGALLLLMLIITSAVAYILIQALKEPA
jgi:hypothetical protein